MADLFPPYVVHENSELEHAIAQLKAAYAVPVKDAKGGAPRYVALERSTLEVSIRAGDVVLFPWAAHFVAGAPEHSALENPKFIYRGVKRPWLVEQNNWSVRDKILAYYIEPKDDWVWRNNMIARGTPPKNALFAVYLLFFPGDPMLDRLQSEVGGRRLHGKIYGWEWVGVNPKTGEPENADSRFSERLYPPK